MRVSPSAYLRSDLTLVKMSRDASRWQRIDKRFELDRWQAPLAPQRNPFGRGGGSPILAGCGHSDERLYFWTVWLQRYPSSVPLELDFEPTISTHDSHVSRDFSSS
jgi:hypothetical protein